MDGLEELKFLFVIMGAMVSTVSSSTNPPAPEVIVIAIVTSMVPNSPEGRADEAGRYTTPSIYVIDVDGMEMG
jgi:hypothetical protein